MEIINEFKKFAVKGNVIDMAVGVIIGGGFGKIVTSLVNDIIMPTVGSMLGGVKFKQLKYVYQAAQDGSPEIALNYGNFIQTSFDFLIVAFCVFMMVRTINKLKKKEDEKPAEPAAPPKQEVLLEEIRDLLKK